MGQYLSILGNIVEVERVLGNIDRCCLYWTIFVNIYPHLTMANSLTSQVAILSKSCYFDIFWIITELPVQVIEELFLLKNKISLTPGLSFPKAKLKILSSPDFYFHKNLE